MFITAAPSSRPTVAPSKAPVSSIPSAAPTITGAVASVSISGAVTESMSEEDVAAISNELAEIYGVDPLDVETTVDYVASGTLDVSIPEGVSEADVIAALEESISDALGVHVKDVVVTIDETGEVRYQVTGMTYEEAEAIQTAASDDSFASKVTSLLNDGDSGVVVDDVVSDTEIDVVISATVDTTDATGTVDRDDAIADLTSSYGLTNSESQGTYFVTRSMLFF